MRWRNRIRAHERPWAPHERGPAGAGGSHRRQTVEIDRNKNATPVHHYRPILMIESHLLRSQRLDRGQQRCSRSSGSRPRGIRYQIGLARLR